MAVHSQPSQTTEKRSTSRIEQPTTPAEAGQILLSALDYCKKAGLAVTGYNEGNALRLSIDGLHYAAGEILPVALKLAAEHVKAMNEKVTRPG